MSGSYAIQNRLSTSAVVIEILSVEDDDNLAYVIMTTLGSVASAQRERRTARRPAPRPR